MVSSKGKVSRSIFLRIWSSFRPLSTERSSTFATALKNLRNPSVRDRFLPLLSPALTRSRSKFVYKDIKYAFQVEQIASDVYRLKIGNNVVDAEVSLASDGALLATFIGETHRIFGMDEHLGLRLVLDGNTLLM
jgi:hypothetical protein